MDYRNIKTKKRALRPLIYLKQIWKIYLIEPVISKSEYLDKNSITLLA